MTHLEILHLAQKGQVDEIRRLKFQTEESGNEIFWNQVYYPKSGDTVMHVAARCGNTNLIRFLHDECKDVNWEQENFDGKRPIHEAAQNGQLESLDQLVSYGVNVNSLKHGDWTPVMLACAKPSLPVIKSLVEAGADLRVTNKDRWTAFHIACREGDVSIVSYLLYCDPTIWKIRSRNGRTPLHTAALHGKLGVVDKLLSRCEFSADDQDSCGSTFFMDAVRADSVEIADLLVRHHYVNVLKRDFLGRQTLHLAAEVGSIKSIKYLVKKLKIDVNSLTTSGQTPLHLACKEGQLEAATLLIDLGVNESHLDSSGRTAMDFATARKDAACIELLQSSCQEIDVVGSG